MLDGKRARAARPARQKLKDRLTRRGLAPALGLAALAMDGEAVSAALPASMIAGTVATLARAATASAIAAGGSTAALELADGVFRAMVIAKLKLAVSFLVVGIVCVAMGAAWLMAKSGSFARGIRDAEATVALRGDGRLNAATTRRARDAGRQSISRSWIIATVIRFRAPRSP